MYDYGFHRAPQFIAFEEIRAVAVKTRKKTKTEKFPISFLVKAYLFIFITTCR